MNARRALEIIAAHGADAARWPAGERAGVLALAGEPPVAAALADAIRLDALLCGWARDVAPMAGLDADRLRPLARPAPARVPRRWFAGGALAAAVAAGIAVLAPTGRGAAPTPTIATNQPAAPSAALANGAASEATADAEAFVTVFTPTADEDELI